MELLDSSNLIHTTNFGYQFCLLSLKSIYGNVKVCGVSNDGRFYWISKSEDNSSNITDVLISYCPISESWSRFKLPCFPDGTIYCLVDYDRYVAIINS